MYRELSEFQFFSYLETETIILTIRKLNQLSP